MAATPHPSQARTMSPRQAANFLREHFSKEEQLAELKAMLQTGGRVSNLAHGIAVELRLIEHEELEVPLTQSLKVKATDVSVGYGGSAGANATQRSEFAGKGPMFARMGGGASETSEGKDDDDDEDSATLELDESEIHGD